MEKRYTLEEAARMLGKQPLFVQLAFMNKSWITVETIVGGERDTYILTEDNIVILRRYFELVEFMPSTWADERMRLENLSTLDLLWDDMRSLFLKSLSRKRKRANFIRGLERLEIDSREIELVQMFYFDGRSIRECAHEFLCSEDMILERLNGVYIKFAIYFFTQV